MVIIVTSREKMLPSQLTSKGLEMRPLAAEHAEEMTQQQVAANMPQAVIAELAAWCGNTPILLSVVCKSIDNSQSYAAQV